MREKIILVQYYEGEETDKNFKQYEQNIESGENPYQVMREIRNKLWEKGHKILDIYILPVID